MTALVLKLALAAVWSVWAAVVDWRTRRIPNALVLAGLAVSVALAFGTGYGEGLGSLGTGLFASLFLLLPFLVRAAGAGDVKMMFVAGVFAGSGMTLPLIVVVSGAGLFLAIGMLLFRRVDGRRLRHFFRSAFDPRYDRAAGRAALPPRESEGCRLPFGAAISAGLVSILALRLLEGGAR